MGKPLLFCDFDGTICHDRFWRSLPTDQYKQVQDFLFGEDKSIVKDWMLGVYTSEQVNKMVAKQIGIPYQTLWELFIRDCETMHVEPSVLQRLHDLRERYVVILLTGNMDSLRRFTVPAQHLDEYFDVIESSSDTGRFKTSDNGTVFAEYAKSYNVPLAECVLIEDSEKTCDAFSSLGGCALRVAVDSDIHTQLDTVETLTMK